MTKTKWIIGVDEAGRGPLAGPVFVGIYAYKKQGKRFCLHEVKDSKQLSESKRVDWFNKLVNNKQDKCAVASTSAKRIDEKGIVWSIHDAMKRALKKIDIEPNACEVLLDGSLHAPNIYKNQKTIIKGDTKVDAISAASILAKVFRDKKMQTIHKKYPEYDFSSNKGYGTFKHRKNIQKYGLSNEHRKTFCKNIKLRKKYNKCRN